MKPLTKQLRRALYFGYSKLNGDRNADMQTNGERWVAEHFIKSGDVVFDVGSSVGDFKKLITVPITYHAFEPRTMKIAVGDFDGTATFCEMEGSEGSALYPVEGRTIKKKYDVKVVKLDTYCKENNIPVIDFLKIDAEGGEVGVLTGAEEMIRNKAIKHIQFEYNTCWVDARKFLRDAYRILDGYEIYKIHPHSLEAMSYTEKSENFIFCNYLAIPV